MLVPLGTRALVRVAPQGVTDTGIHLPDTAVQAQPDFAVLIALGDEAKTYGRLMEGSKVVFTRTLASKKEDDGSTLYLLESEDILAVDE